MGAHDCYITSTKQYDTIQSYVTMYVRTYVPELREQ